MRVRAIGSAALICALLSGCSEQADDTTPKLADGYEKIACAVGGASDLKEVCAVERTKVGDLLQLVVHHPDGGFRRFEVRSDGTGLAPADGADDAQREVGDGQLDLTVSGDTYRFPATIETDDPMP